MLKQATKYSHITQKQKQKKQTKKIHYKSGRELLQLWDLKYLKDYLEDRVKGLMTQWKFLKAETQSTDGCITPSLLTVGWGPWTARIEEFATHVVGKWTRLTTVPTLFRLFSRMVSRGSSVKVPDSTGFYRPQQLRTSDRFVWFY